MPTKPTMSLHHVVFQSQPIQCIDSQSSLNARCLAERRGIQLLPPMWSGPPYPASTVDAVDTVDDSPVKKPQTRCPRQQKEKSPAHTMPVQILPCPLVGPVRELTFDNVVRARGPGDLFSKVDNIIQQTMHIQGAPLAAPQTALPMRPPPVPST